MSFDTSWNVNEFISMDESFDQWQFRKTFLTTNKHKYPKDQLLVLSNIFIFIEFEKCSYPKAIMDLIENLSKGFVDQLRNIFNLPKISTTDSNAAGAEDNENAPKKTKYFSPWSENYILPGFMLLINNHTNQTNNEMNNQSCSFSGIPIPKITIEIPSENHYRVKLYYQKKLMAVGNSIEPDWVLENAAYNALEMFRKMCFVITVKEYKQSRITMLDVMDDSTIDTSNYTTHHSKISENKVGYMILKNMGWKEGDGLGKNNQGITSPIETIRFKERFGLDIENYDSNPNTNRNHLIDFNIQAEKYIMRFLYGPKKRLAFSTMFTKDERKIIHSICTKVGIWTKIYGKKGNKRQLLAVKKQTAKEIFDELSNCSNFENDYYVLKPPLIKYID